MGLVSAIGEARELQFPREHLFNFARHTLVRQGRSESQPATQRHLMKNTQTIFFAVIIFSLTLLFRRGTRSYTLVSQLNMGERARWRTATTNVINNVKLLLKYFSNMHKLLLPSTEKQATPLRLSKS